MIEPCRTIDPRRSQSPRACRTIDPPPDGPRNGRFDSRIFGPMDQKVGSPKTSLGKWFEIPRGNLGHPREPSILDPDKSNGP